MSITKRFIIGSIFCFLNTLLFASPGSWDKSLVADFNVSQVGYKDWQKGGEDAFSWQAVLRGEFDKKGLGYRWENDVKIAYGQSRLGTGDNQKILDELFYETVYIFERYKIINPYISSSISTQLSKSYDYDESPEIELSNFMDPGFIRQSAGISTKIHDTLSLRAGVSLKQTITKIHTDFSDGDTFLLDKGLDFVVEFDHNLSETLSLVSKLDVFSSLEGVDEIDYNLDTNLVVKLSDHFQGSMSIQMIYDKDVADTQQVKNFLGLGLTYIFLK